MSESRVEVIRSVFEAFSRRDATALAELMEEDVEFLPVTANLTTGGLPYRGHAGIAEYIADVARVWDDLRVEPIEFREVDDAVVVLGRMRGRGGGMIIDQPTGWVWRFRGARVAWGRVFTSHEEALDAAESVR